MVLIEKRPSPSLFYRVRRTSLSPFSYIGMKYAQMKQHISEWRERTWTVDEPIIHPPVYIVSSFLQNKEKFADRERMIEIAPSYGNGILPRLDSWPYRRRKRHHYSKLQHARLAFLTVKANFISTYITPFVDMTTDRIANEQYEFHETLSRVKKVLSLPRR